MLVRKAKRAIKKLTKFSENWVVEFFTLYKGKEKTIKSTYIQIKITNKICSIKLYCIEAYISFVVNKIYRANIKL